eukprot:TRINITY_DN15289_c0_g1_i1.p1 TRINITY_DN15289_c0_g1~~TRINITY_DN15289_c0_g1_i1.p1  ORF type:complete len:408 (+),score=146.24 TRINITY_DN15289_c0_g1_i1:98-1321(+)
MVRQDHISLGKGLDDLIDALRSAFAFAISLPIAWMTLHPTIDAFKAHKEAKVEKGTRTVLALQGALRRPLLQPVLDVFFQVFSFCGEQDFYTLVLPFLIWNKDRVLGRRVTLLVCLGLVAGNIMKDVFELPRPRSPPVWRPGNNLDSTRLGDFGFPSTHAMNGVTNAVYVYLRVVGGTPANVGLAFFSRELADGAGQLAFGAMVMYISMMCISRMYLGAHTPTDIRGGVVLGVLWVTMWFFAASVVDTWCLTTEHLIPKLIAAAVVALVINPQPEPKTPTFMQNANVLGLSVGCMVGVRQYYDLAGSAEEMGFLGAAPGGYGTIAVRSVFGYAAVAAVKVVVKAGATGLLKALGIAYERQLVDLVGASAVRFFTYFAIAWSITFLVPVAHCFLGLATYQAEDISALV